MLAHEEVWAAIDALASRHRLSASGLARRSGLDPTTFNKSKRHAADSRPRWPSTESIAKILRATNTSVADFFRTTGVAAPAANVIAVPLVGEAHAGFQTPIATHGDAIRLPLPARIVNFPDKRYDPLYALSVVGDSMRPLYRNGDILFVAPEATIAEGDRVVVKLRDKDVLVKVLKSRTPTDLCFHAVNEDHPDIAVNAGAVEWIARIVYATQ